MKITELLTGQELEVLTHILHEAEFLASGQAHRTVHADWYQPIRSITSKLFDQIELEVLGETK